MSVCTTEQYIETKLKSMENRMVSEFDVSREMLDKIHVLRQVSGCSLTQWGCEASQNTGRRDCAAAFVLLRY